MKILIISFILLINYSSADSFDSQSKKEKNIKFKVDIKKVMKGQFQYALRAFSVDEFLTKTKSLVKLDSLNLLNQPTSKQVVLRKAAFLVNRPIGFFDHEIIKNEKFWSAAINAALIKTGPDEFLGIDNQPEKNKFIFKSYFDSDDISTLPRAKIISAAGLIKKLDIISQSASSVVINELAFKSGDSIGRTDIFSFISLNENSTLVIWYSLKIEGKVIQTNELADNSFKQEISRIKKATKEFTDP